MAEPMFGAKADLFRVLSHPARVRVLELLGQRDHAVHELLAAIPIEGSSLSQQLAVLRRAGLVRQQRAHGEVRYTLVEPALGGLLAAAGLVRSVAIADQAVGQRALQPAMFDPAEPSPEVRP